MNWLPDDLPSFLWGVVVGAVGLFIAGFLNTAGADAWKWIKARVAPPPLEPIVVERTFKPTRYDPGSCAWVREERLLIYEEKGYRYYPHPRNNAKCYRLVHTRTHTEKEYLMVSPAAVELTSS